MVAHPFHDGGAHTPDAASVLYGQDAGEALRHFAKKLLVERFQEAEVVVCGSCSIDGACGFRTYGAEGDDSHVLAVAKAAAAPYGEFLHGLLPVRAASTPSRITYDEGALAFKLRRVHEIPELYLVVGTCYR